MSTRFDHLVFYDSECGFCKVCLAVLLTWDRRRRMSPVPINEANTWLGELEEHKRGKSWHIASPSRGLYSAGQALVIAFGILPGGAPLSAVTGRLLGLTEAGYRAIERNRSRLGRLLPTRVKIWADRRIKVRKSEVTADGGGLKTVEPIKVALKRTFSAPSAPFLTAAWRNVVAATYAVDEAVLAPYLPPGVEVDKLDGAPRVSLVAFDFHQTRVHGIQVPTLTDFPEINLRFYVRFRGERGVVFVREFVPSPLIAGVARFRYNEPYRTLKMSSSISTDGEAINVRHNFGPQAEYSLRCSAQTEGYQPDEESAEYWLTHHIFGFGKTRSGRTRAYRVEHPVWDLHPITSFECSADFEQLYGKRWGFLNDVKPSHITFAKGSPITVFTPIAVRD